MHLVDRRRVGHLLVVAGADLRVGDLGGDLPVDQLRCAARAAAGIPCAAGNPASLSRPLATAFAASSLISMIADRAAARRCSAGSRANCWSRSPSASSRSASVTGWPLIVASTVSGRSGGAAGAGAGAGGRGILGTAGSRAQTGQRRRLPTCGRAGRATGRNSSKGLRRGRNLHRNSPRKRQNSGVVASVAATLTSVRPPLICPSSLRPEPISGRLWLL